MITLYVAAAAKSLQSCPMPQMAAHQAPLSLGFSRKEHWSGCHFLLQCIKVKSESEVAQSGPTLSDPMDCSLPGSFVHGIFRKSTGVGCHCLLQKTGWQFLKKLNLQLPYDSVILLNISSKRTENIYPHKTCTGTFIAT